MHDNNLNRWSHEHTFSQDKRRSGESRTLVVILITATMMIIEIFAGIHFGSMALLADGLHMASHTMALAITIFAYIYARHHARNKRFSFGTGKVNALGGFTGAILLAVFALYMGYESLIRLMNPVAIEFNQAILVAVLGLIINAASVLILGSNGHHHNHSNHHDHHHDHSNHHDHNLRSAYWHIMADALTSVLAIVALLSAKYFGWIWMDPTMGILGALLVFIWSYSLLGSSGSVLLDCQASPKLQQLIQKAIESDNDSRITDLHIWSIGPGIFAAQITLVAHNPLTPNEYKKLIPHNPRKSI